MDTPVTRRAFLGGSAAVVAALSLGGCRSSRRAGGPTELRLPGGSFGFPSPFATIAGPGYVQMSYIYDTLLWKDASGRLLPWLAQSVERSHDGLTYTFHLRKGITWQDGRALTAEDVVFTFEYFARQPLGPLIIAQPFGVQGARAVGAGKVVIELELPAVTFLEAVAGAVPIIPKHIWSGIADAPHAQDMAVLVGSGPYRLHSYSPGEGASLYLANDDHFLGRPYVRRLELRPVDDELSALLAGDVDVAETAAEGTSSDALSPFHGNAYDIVHATGGFMFPLIWNLARESALTDVRVRRAFALAIDRGAIVERLLSGNGLAGNPGFLPPNDPFFVPTEQYAFDPAAAERLLDEAGFRSRTADGLRRDPNGRVLRFSVVTGNSPIPAALDLIVEGLKRIGIQLRPQAVDLPTLFGRLQQGADEIALSLYPGPGGTAPNADPDTMRTFYSSRIKGRLQGAQGYLNADLDRLADRQLVTADPAERKRELARMQHLVARDLPALPLYYPTLFTVFRREVFDSWYYTPGGFAGGLPGPYNKQVFVTGVRTGLRIHRPQ